ncbi:adenylyl-sulfate kinase [Pseudoalteromonas sp. PS5]|nr:adenylyl-sulfate kinase [Pseudoalteromonas sp. PS5]
MSTNLKVFLMVNKKGSTIWITGLSGAGKTTITNLLIPQFQGMGINPIILDGDEIRAAIRDPHWQFDTNSRLLGSYRYSRLARLFTHQKQVVIVPTISMFHEVQRWNREYIPNYFEVFLDVDIKARISRDPKGLYQNEPSHMVEDSTAELPQFPDMRILNNGEIDDATVKAEEIFTEWKKVIYDA